MSNSLPRTMRRKPSMRTGTSTKSNAKVFGLTLPSLRAWLLPWVRVTVFSLSSAMGRASLWWIAVRHCMPNIVGASSEPRSTAIAAEALGYEERILQPGKREVIADDLPYRLENLVLIPLRLFRPERHNCL